MDPETKKLLEEVLELGRDNNKMLKKVRGVQKREAVWGALKMVLIIGIAFGSFYFLQPYVDQLMSMYSSISTASQKLNSSISTASQKLNSGSFLKR